MDWRTKQSRRTRDSREKSYNEYASYLCQEVFTDMSVLPLVFPSNISCFSRGSYKEELARRRELPVPPLPKRSGVLARSEDNLAGLHPLSIMSPSSTTPAILTRHSSYTLLHEESDSVAMLKRRHQEEQRSASSSLEVVAGEMGAENVTAHSPYRAGEEQATHVGSELVQAVRCSSDERAVDQSSHEEMGEEESDVREGGSDGVDGDGGHIQSLIEIRDIKYNTVEVDEGDDEVINSENNNAMNTDIPDENKVIEDSLSKMSKFKKTEKSSLFRSAIDRLSFRSRKKKEKKNDVEIIPKKEEDDPIAHQTIVSEDIVKEIQPNKPEPDEHKTNTKEEPPKMLLSILPPPIPSSATSSQSRPIIQLETALKSFKLAAAKSRENLSLSRPDISQAIIPFTSQPRIARTVIKHCPPTPSASWRQKPPSSNCYVEAEWKKLSASMINLNQSRRNLAGKETDLTKTEVSLRSSNMSLDTGSLVMGMEKVMVEEVTVARAQSMNVLDMAGGERKIQIPCNQLMQMNPYQRRVQASMERLSVPSWYKPSDTPSPSPTTPHTPRWRQAGGGSSSSSSSSSAGWRRHISHTASPSTTSTLERNSTPLSSQRYRSRFGTLPSSTRSPSNSSINSSSSTISSTPSKQVYLGWRSQERLDIGPAYLTSPAQRLASSAIPCSVKPGSRSATATAATDTATAKEGIKEVTEAILDFCNSPIGDKPPQVKEAWPHVDDDSDENSDNLDDDSGIDRSDDFTQEILNEA